MEDRGLPASDLLQNDVHAELRRTAVNENVALNRVLAPPARSRNASWARPRTGEQDALGAVPAPWRPFRHAPRVLQLSEPAIAAATNET